MKLILFSQFAQFDGDTSPPSPLLQCSPAQHLKKKRTCLLQRFRPLGLIKQRIVSHTEMWWFDPSLKSVWQAPLSLCSPSVVLLPTVLFFSGSPRSFDLRLIFIINFFSSSSWRARGFTANFPLEWENTRGSFRYFLPRPTWAKKKCFHHIFFANTKPSIKLILHFFSGFPETLWKNKFCVIPSKPYIILIPSQSAGVFKTRWGLNYYYSAAGKCVWVHRKKK